MESKLSAEEVWEQIERQHDPEKNHVANTYAITLNNGVTYLYTATEEGRLVSIDDWFKGYVAQYGTKESGFPYAVCIEKYKILVRKIIGEQLCPPLCAIKKSSPTGKLFFNAKYAQMLSVVDNYFFDGNEYLIVEIGKIERFVFCVTTQKFVDRFICGYINYDGEYEPRIVYDDWNILFRLPHEPYRYALAYQYADYDESIVRRFALLDLVKRKQRVISNSAFREIKIGTPFNDIYPIYVNKGHRLWGCFAISPSVNKKYGELSVVRVPMGESIDYNYRINLSNFRKYQNSHIHNESLLYDYFGEFESKRKSINTNSNGIKTIPLYIENFDIKYDIELPNGLKSLYNINGKQQCKFQKEENKIYVITAEGKYEINAEAIDSKVNTYPKFSDFFHGQNDVEGNIEITEGKYYWSEKTYYEIRMMLCIDYTQRNKLWKD